MDILVFSDTHGMLNDLKKVKEKVNNVDLIIHLGDYTKDTGEIKKIFNKEVICVKGNCDISDNNTKEEEILTINDKRILLTHGHKYKVKMDINNIYYRGIELEVDLVLFGHTHLALNIENNGLKLFNPGSLSYPRNREKTFGVLNITDKIGAQVIAI
ncbi:metallophosphoesterase [Dethiothermospora halolimnae]|uniref:metallophosphoesterase n=1 Tax=Dethiothermospora halolimnae TaxID=3114390 RepID=UPI003CCC2A47